MRNSINVGISDMKIAKNDDILVTFALGSCIGICLLDSVVKIGALCHIMLPNYPVNSTAKNENVLKFADSSIPHTITLMERMGCKRHRIIAKIAGGAKMFDVSGDSTFGNIGSRNTEAVKDMLRKMQIPLRGEDTGLNYGRTVYFYLDNGSVEIKSYSKQTKIL